MNEGSKDKEFSLPRLNEGLSLQKGPPDHDGAPTYTLYNPAADKFYRLDWAEFECLSRFHACENAKDLKERVEEETPVSVSQDDIRSLISFLLRNGLVTLEDQHNFQALSQKQIPSKASHPPLNFFKTYLFFRIPLFNPEPFLQRLYPKVRSLLTKQFVYTGLAVFLVGVILVSQRLDEFFSTFVYMFSLPGLVTTLLVFAGIKIIHELAHALTAHKFGVNVPHMGVAFIICYPVLYTEVSGSWRLSRRSERMYVGLAGVIGEIILAGLFLIIWWFYPDGLLGSVAFTVVVISLISSLLINLNPLMRFDGYYVLSDIMGIDNLQYRGIAFARWSLRRVLFNLPDPEPEPVSRRLSKFLIFFGYSLLIYRAVLFIGIAIILYVLFFKPLGLILMMLEIALLVLWPIAAEMNVWWKRRADIIQTRRSRITFGLAGLFLLVFFLPLQGDIRAPAVATAAQYRVIYPPVPAKIKSINVKQGEMVEKGESLMQLQAPELEYRIEQARLELEKALTRKRLSRLVTYQEANEEDQNLALSEKVTQARERLKTTA